MDKKKPLNQPRKQGKTPIKAAPVEQKPKRDYHVIVLWLMIALVSYIRCRLISVPFERDEGEYGYIGTMFLHGIAPFKDAYSMKLPGTSFMYAVLMTIFGHTSKGVHLGMLFINATTMYFLFAGFKKLFNPFIGLSTASIFGLMAIGMPFDGFAAHATQFICFYSSLALFFFTGFMQSGKLLKVFLFGLMLGMAFLMKQQAIFLIVFGIALLLIYLIKEKKQSFPEIFKNLFVFGVGVFIPYIIVVLIIIAAGQFKVFWLWTVQYASTYESVKSLHLIKALFFSSFDAMWAYFYYLWVLGIAGALVFFWSPYTLFQKLFILIYCAASLLALSSGFYFRPHYFVVILPAIGLLIGILIEFIVQQVRSRMNTLKSSNAVLVILSAVIIFTIYVNKLYYFTYPPNVVCNLSYWGNPFNEAVEISKYIKENTKDTDKIAVLGSEPEICFYADRFSASGYLYTYPLVEDQPYNLQMQDQMITEIEKNKPAYFIFCNVLFSWLVNPKAPKKIFEWGNTYLSKYYSPVGFADFYSNRGWRIYWNDDIKNREANPESSVIILKRNPDIKQ